MSGAARLRIAGVLVALCATLVTIMASTAVWAQSRPVPVRSSSAPPPVPPGTPGAPPAAGAMPGTNPGTTPGAAPAQRRTPALPPRVPRAVDAGSAPLLPTPAQTEAAYESAEVLVMWRDPRRFALDYAALIAFRSAELEQQNLPALGARFVRYRFADEAAALAFRDLIIASYPAAEAERNWRYGALGAPRLYAAERVGLPQTSALPPLRARIGMLDTSVQPGAALAGSQITQRSFIGNESAADPAHGTAVASLIAGRDVAARFQAPAHGVSLYAGGIMRAQARAPGSTTAMLLTGLDWLLGNRVSVINLSVGGPGDALLRFAIERCVQDGVALVAAAGNGGPDAPPVYPAAYPGVIAVTAIDAANAPYSGAQRGSHILIAAPGVEVWAPDDAGGGYHSGTSFAAALTSGVLARQLALRARKPEAARLMLCSSARDLGEPGRDEQFGCGLLQWPASQ